MATLFHPAFLTFEILEEDFAVQFIDKPMFMIDVVLKNTPSLLSVQRKSGEEAEALYKQVLDAMQSGNPVMLELTCEQQVGKKFAVLVSEISAVQLSEKSGSGMASGRPPGFFALTE